MADRRLDAVTLTTTDASSGARGESAFADLLPPATLAVLLGLVLGRPSVASAECEVKGTVVDGEDRLCAPRPALGAVAGVALEAVEQTCPELLLRAGDPAAVRSAS